MILYEFNFIHMKKLLATGLIFITVVSCNKILAKTCYECEVKRMDGSTYKKDVCVDEGESVPQFTDDYGNDLASYCKKK